MSIVYVVKPLIVRQMNQMQILVDTLRQFDIFGMNMQTFLPYPDITQSLSCLDEMRSWKQTVEAFQLVKTIEEGGGWRNHPAAKMWVNFVDCLKLYANLALTESLKRGIRVKAFTPYPIRDDVLLPPWIGGKIHETHRSNLLRKKPEYYGQFGWVESSDIPYHWPVV